jgi:hypothetical protein
VTFDASNRIFSASVFPSPAQTDPYVTAFFPFLEVFLTAAAAQPVCSSSSSSAPA